MNRFGRVAMMGRAAAVVLFLGALRSAAVPMPEFGNSVQFDKAGPDISIAKLKGKTILVLFFQSWCPKCNAWSGTMLKQIEEAHGENRGMALVAIKTDGGGIPAARDYLKSKGVDLDKWYVGSDSDATYYKQVHGKDELWCYAIVNSKGEIAGQEKAGSHYTTGPDNGKYSLATKWPFKDCGKPETVLPADKEYPSDLSRVVRFAEAGSLGKALALLGAGGRKPGDAAARDGLKQDILTVADTRMRAQMDIIKDASRDSASRYSSCIELGMMVRDLGSLPVAREASAVLNKAAADPAIQKERAAETAYWTTMQRLDKASKRDRPRVLMELEAMAKKYEGTKYGQLAADAAHSDAKAQ